MSRTMLYTKQRRPFLLDIRKQVYPNSFIGIAWPTITTDEITNLTSDIAKNVK